MASNNAKHETVTPKVLSNCEDRWICSEAM